MGTEPQYRVKDATGTITVYTRNHINRCQLTDPNQNNCSCPKWIYANRKGHTPSRYAAETPSFAQACQIAKHTHDGWHPEIEQARKQTLLQERKRRPITEVVNAFIDDRVAEGAVRGTTEQYKGIIGYVTNGQVRGHFLKWVAAHNVGLSEEERLTYITDIDVTALSTFKTKLMLALGSDATRHTAWVIVRTFFRWAFERGFIATFVAETFKSPLIRKGNRCGVWTEQQYQALQVATSYFDSPINGLAPELRPIVKQRVSLVMQLMRFSGMAIVDVVLFSPSVDNHGLGVGDDGVLRYRRRKTGELAVVPIESETLLRAIRAGIPLEPNSDPHHPFAHKGINLSDEVRLVRQTEVWTNRLSKIYETAGITEITTEVGKKRPHVHMFRDTFAKWHLDRGTDIRDLQKMLGHSSVTTTERAYASWMKDDQQAMIDRVRSRLAGNVIRTSAATWKASKKGLAAGA